MSYTSCADLLHVEDVRDGLLVRFHARSLHKTNALPLATELLDLAFQRGGPRLYLDFSEVEHLEHSVLLGLTMLSWRLQGMGDRLVLLNLRPGVRDALRASQLVENLVPHEDANAGDGSGGLGDGS